MSRIPAGTRGRTWRSARRALVRAQAQALRDEAPVRTLLARVLRVHTDERAFRIGADGEERVGSRLQKLAKKDPRWRFVNSVPVGEGSSDIDHVVIGPAGVFTLNTKHHPGRKLWVGGDTFMVGSHRQPYVRNSRHEARRASQLLTAAAGVPVAVRGVIVIADADDMTIKAQPADVLVLWRQALVRWLRGLPEALDEATTDGIYDVARRSTTWRPSAGQ